LKTKNEGKLFGKEIKLGGFKEAYDSLPFNKRSQVRDQLCNTCYWSINTFRTKLSGKIPFRIYEIEKIESIFKIHNLNAWTGEELTV
jgi:hypothetical protein